MNCFSLLYIDPGTGSMLFSILIGVVATSFFLGKALLLKIKLFFSSGKDDVKLDVSFKEYVIYCEDKRYWTVFKPVIEEFETRKIPLTYYTSAKDDPVFEKSYEYITSEFIGEGNKAFVKLNMLSAGIILMTTPGLDVYQLKRSKNVKHYSHIFHSTTDSTMYRLFGIDYFDSILMTGDYQEEDIRILEEQRGLPAKDLVTVGCTYLDVLQERISSIPDEENHNYTVLVSPSWGESALLSKYGEKILDPLLDAGFNVILRPHPQSRISEVDLLERLKERYKDTLNLTWDNNRDNIYSMKRADIMISDFSGIIFDYTFLCDKPVIYANSEMDLRIYDAYDIQKKLWLFSTLERIGIKLEEKEFSNIKEMVLNATDSEKLASERRKAKNEGWMYRGEAGKRTADYMIKVVSEFKGVTC